MSDNSVEARRETDKAEQVKRDAANRAASQQAHAKQQAAERAAQKKR